MVMARGWESKDIAAQVEATQAKDPKHRPAQKTPEQLQRDQERKSLELSRVRIVNDLSSATHPQHRKSLEAALAHLDAKISSLT
jgi:Asp-tRNA(Asn)/Glu-tRNA(Gln) amidotransferase A subunit family amidase